MLPLPGGACSSRLPDWLSDRLRQVPFGKRDLLAFADTTMERVGRLRSRRHSLWAEAIERGILEWPTPLLENRGRVLSTGTASAAEERISRLGFGNSTYRVFAPIPFCGPIPPGCPPHQARSSALGPGFGKRPTSEPTRPCRFRLPDGNRAAASRWACTKSRVTGGRPQVPPGSRDPLTRTTRKWRLAACRAGRRSV
jgi:hypothetical protein